MQQPKTRKRYQQGWFVREGGHVYHRFRDIRPDGQVFTAKLLIGTEEEYPTDQLALLSPLVVAALKRLNGNVPQAAASAVTVTILATDFKDKYCVRPNLAPGTIAAYGSYIRKWLVPRWGSRVVTEITLPEANRWLAKVDLAPKSKSSLRWMIKEMWDYAMREGLIPTGTINIWEKVDINEPIKRTYTPASFTPMEFRYMLDQLQEMDPLVYTAAALCACLGPRISEVLGLKFSDVDKKKKTITITAGWTGGEFTDLKNEASRGAVPMSPELEKIIDKWRDTTPYNKDTDWVFASDRKRGKEPRWADSMRSDYLHVAIERAIAEMREDGYNEEADVLAAKEHLGWHTFRHTHKAWHNIVGTPIELQQRLLRHADRRTTEQYGVTFDVTDKQRQANSKVIKFALKKVATA